MGVEAGLPVDAFAETLSAAWCVEGLFDTSTLAGISGVQECSELFGLDRVTNARRLCSVQAASAVRSGELAMSSADLDANLHCDFQRDRVVAESLFAATVVTDEIMAPVHKASRYVVPPLS
jgi:hypothetical protein